MRARLGQHFLINKSKIQKIISALEVKNGDTIIEIGAGHGELTRELVKCPGVSIIALEKDRGLALKLKENFKFQISNFETNPKSQITKLQIIESDALKILPALIRNLKLGIRTSGCKIAGNIPYYITGRLLRILSELENKPLLTVLTIQKEVALRICAKPPKMNLLAAATQFWAKPEIVGFIPQKDFSPPPEVDSAIIKLGTRNKKQETGGKEQANRLALNYYKFIKVFFKQPRKTIFNNLLPLSKNKDGLKIFLDRAGVSPSARPQGLSLKEIEKLLPLLGP